MCTAIYLGALRAMVRMGQPLGEDTAAYAALAEKSKVYLETQLFKWPLVLPERPLAGFAGQAPAR